MLRCIKSALSSQLRHHLSTPSTICLKRGVHWSVPEENEELISMDNFEDIYHTLKLPYKMSHPDKLEMSKMFIKYRVETYPTGMKPIELEAYQELYDHLQGEERNKIMDDISLVLLYYNRILANTIFCPSTIPLEDMRKIIFCYNSYSRRIGYLSYLFVREFDIWRCDISHQKQKEEKKLQEELEMANFYQIGCFNTKGELQYGYWRNTLFGKYFETAKSKYSLNRLRQAELFGQKFVIDCSFDESMADYETASVARQIVSIYRENRYNNPDPFHLLFCGYEKSNRGYRYAVDQLLDIINNPAYCLNFREETYQELLPNQRFIYLSPDARDYMTKFDPNAVYIIGALVSKTLKSQFTLDKARAQGIETVRLPIQKYVALKPGVKKVLSFQGVFKILMEFRQHGDWERAFRAGILPHKLMDGGDYPLEGDNSDSE